MYPGESTIFVQYLFYKSEHILIFFLVKHNFKDTYTFFVLQFTFEKTCYNSNLRF